jgi:hypothetical protein
MLVFGVRAPIRIIAVIRQEAPSSAFTLFGNDGPETRDRSKSV